MNRISNTGMSTMCNEHGVMSTLLCCNLQFIIQLVMKFLRIFFSQKKGKTKHLKPFDYCKHVFLHKDFNLENLYLSQYI